MCILSGCQTEAWLDAFKGQEAGQQALGDLKVVAIETGCCLCDIPKLMGQFFLNDGAELCLVSLQCLQLHKHKGYVMKTSMSTTVYVTWQKLRTLDYCLKKQCCS